VSYALDPRRTTAMYRRMSSRARVGMDASLNAAADTDKALVSEDVANAGRGAITGFLVLALLGAFFVYNMSGR
jgi:hypothetical protein